MKQNSWNRRCRGILIWCAIAALGTTLLAADAFVVRTPSAGAFPLAQDGRVVPWVVSSADHAGVLRVMGHLEDDLQRVTGSRPERLMDRPPSSGPVVIAGTLGRHGLIDRLVSEGRFDTTGLSGRWEMYVIQAVREPFPGIPEALLIVGSDKRGTIFGMFEMSKQMGVSPWYWWADVPAKRSSELYILPGRHSDGEPKVRYRGIFINDEAPAMSGWTTEKFGGFNAKMYAHVFELILRLKGNFLWPAMWGRAFYDDDPENPRLADEYGVVISTSHHEPMMRAHDEWRRYGGGGVWNYERNERSLREFWRAGIRRMGSYESVVTLAMRGDGDEAMSPDANVGLLERIVRDQREIIGEVTGKDVTATPQVWAVYKEVQEYYDKGMRVPDDVTVLLCDDNWGNVRKLPDPQQPSRRGGYGLYYHYDFVGGPRNYKWLNTSQIERVWEQLHLTWRHGVDRIWVVNVGDIKPMEFPISFFLDYAWDPERWPLERLPDYSRLWAEQQFGPEHAPEIAGILDAYTKFNARRKPELLSPETYSLVNFLEAERVVESYRDVVLRAERLYERLPVEARDAFYQLALHQPLACATVNDLYISAGMNHLYARQGRSGTNRLADRVRELYAKDKDISSYYNTVLSGGKWNHMMDQTHIGYTYWQQPDVQTMPEVKEIDVPIRADMGVSIEGAEAWWPEEDPPAELPEIDVVNGQRRYFEIFNRGRTAFRASIASSQPWVQLSESSVEVDDQRRVWVSVNAASVPPGRHRVPITVNGPDGRTVTVYAKVFRPQVVGTATLRGFFVSEGVVSIDADQYDRRPEDTVRGWQRIPNLGRTGSSMTTTTAGKPLSIAVADSLCLEYTVVLHESGMYDADLLLSPLQDFMHNGGIRVAVSVDDGPPSVINVNSEDTVPDFKYPMWWNTMVSNNIRTLTTRHQITVAGEHRVRVWRIDPGVVLQKIVVRSRELPTSYLGPPGQERRAFPGR